MTQQVSLPELNSWDADWSNLNILVTGIGVAGFSCADTLLEKGATVTVFDGSDPEKIKDSLQTLEIIGGKFTNDEAKVLRALSDYDLIVTSPGWPPYHKIFKVAAKHDIPIWGDVELAWRLHTRKGKKTAKWLLITGTNGKTTTTGMLESILHHAGLKAKAVGNIGFPILDAIREPEEYDVFAAELSSFQLHWSESVSAEAAVVLNIAADHLDWHGSEEEYIKAKAKIFNQVKIACIYNLEDPVTLKMVEQADVVEGARAVAFTKGTPERSMLGVVEDVLCDRAFLPNRQTHALELCTFADLGEPLASHTITNALAAAGLARAIDVEPAAIQAGLKNYRSSGHRIEKVAEIDGVTWINDSKATNSHAAAASLSAFEEIVWIAGGLAKGARYEDFISEHGHRLKAVILIGEDKSLLKVALTEKAPAVPIYETTASDGQEVMAQAVTKAKEAAVSGDVVLLAPAAASMDQFKTYADRGEKFAAEVEKLED
ncbi:MAG: UDP-N-acetylmuramoyl-L-alanine--D-glutamate ligase [Micrococcaceae bacterium]